MKICEFHPLDILDGKILFEGQPGSRQISIADAVSWSKCGQVYSIRHDQKLLAIGGFFDYWQGRKESWCIFFEGCQPMMPEICRLMKEGLSEESKKTKRIEAVCYTSFDKGNRFMQVLGFELEATLKNYFPDGHSANMYRYRG